jgi:hypothetical protein
MAEQAKVSEAVQAAFANSIKFVINETVEDPVTKKNKYQKIAELDMPIPTLEEFGIDAARKPLSKDDGIDEHGKDEDGIPAYVDEKFDWLQFAIVQQLKAQNRNKVDGKEMKEGMKFPTNFAELVAVGERSGEALKNRHLAKAAFAAYLKSKNKADVVVKLLSDLFIDANSITVAKDDFVEALESHLKQWVPALDEVNKGKFERTIEKAVEAINGRQAVLESMKA